MEKVYIVILTPHGDLEEEATQECLGVFETKREAIERALLEYKNDHLENDYVVDENELNDFKNENRNYLDVYYHEIENYSCFYSLFVYEQEYKKRKRVK